MNRTLNVAMVGTGFMGRAHSNAFLSVNRFFDLPMTAGLHTVVGRDRAGADTFARRWGWSQATADLAGPLQDQAIGLVDVATPNDLHATQAIAALGAGKHVVCEKPLAGTLKDATAMRDAARKAARRGVHTFVWFNYRRCPPVAFAHRLVADGRLGRLYHVRARYLQDWGGPDTPRTWRFDASRAGSGAHGDLNAHVVDLARFLTGDEIVEVAGAIEQRFIDRRPAPGRRAKGSSARRASSTVDDCTLFLARFASGAVASFEASRLATGHLNANEVELNGRKGSLRFDLERMNELWWFDATAPAARRGWTLISCTSKGAHPYVGAYWPPGHPLGYEHQFISQTADMIRVLAGRRPVVPLADFEDAWRTQRVLDAALAAARERRAVTLERN